MLGSEDGSMEYTTFTIVVVVPNHSMLKMFCVRLPLVSCLLPFALCPTLCELDVPSMDDPMRLR